MLLNRVSRGDMLPRCAHWKRSTFYMPTKMPLVQTKQERRERPCQLNRASVVLGSVLDAAPAPDDEADELDAACSLLFIQIDNSEHPQHTMMQIQTKDYPGLHRAVAWTLNGLSIRAQNAEIKRDPDGEYVSVSS